MRPFLMASLAAALLLAGCAGSAWPSESPSPTQAGGVSGTGQPPSVARPSGRAAPGAAVGSDQDLVARGKVIFEQAAGGVGCAFCHGLDGRGKAEFASPDIRGKGAADVLDAMATRTLMNSVKLSDEEVRAVVAYLAVLPR